MIKYTVSASKRLWLLACTYIAGLVLASVTLAILLAVGSDSLAMMRIGIVVQDVLMLVVPAVVTAVIVTRQPVELLRLGKFPRLQPLLLGLLTLVVATPLMEAVVQWNEGITLPSAFSDIESWLRRLEEQAGGSVEFLLGPHTFGNLAVSILLVGVLTGFSEELFFRGALQRLLASTRMGTHAAVWVAAIIFSAVHMQFFGFVPRMLLGAFFGYLLVWSGSIWLPMIAHTLNNSLYIITRYANAPEASEAVSATNTSWGAIIISAAFTAVCLTALYLTCNGKKPDPEQKEPTDE
ncbi:MAG: CPBP family intramembrane metalloprotease [Muribaculaceae bacterium]|nr:CPBP family intramembrane metalloprotease [Muribaculaceae bacterium]